MRTLQTLEFVRREHQVTLLAPAPAGGPATAPAGCRLETYRAGGWSGAAAGVLRALRRNLPLQSALFHHPDLGRRLRELAPRADLVILQLVRLAIHLDDVGTTPLVADLVDSLSLSFSLRTEIDRAWRRPFLKLEARSLARWERRMVERAAAAVLVSDRDRQALANRLPPQLSRRLAVVPLAVRQRREPPVGPVPAPGGAPPVLAITGNLGYFVNADAVAWFLREVWPELRRRRPGLRLVVAGDRPSRRLGRTIAGAGAELVASPPDLRRVLAGATLALAPMRAGAGLPIKVLEAWSMGVPVVGSPWAVAGTSGQAGVDFRVVVHPREWVETILELLDDPAARRALATAGRARLAADYARQVVRRQWLELLRRGAASDR